MSAPFPFFVSSPVGPCFEITCPITALDMERPVNLGQWLSFVPLGGSGCGRRSFTTVEHSDTRGSMPHNRDPSGSAPDNLRGLVHRPSA